MADTTVADTTMFQLGSPEWLAALRALLTDLVAKNQDVFAGVSFSCCEIFTDMPPDGATCVNCFEIVDGKVLVHDEARPSDMEVKGDYEAIRPVAKLVYATATEADTAWLEKHRQAMIDAGRLTRREARPDALPPEAGKVLSGVHDSLARRTI